MTATEVLPHLAPDAEVERLREEVARLERENEELREENERLREENERLRKKDAEQGGRPRKNSQNSSLSPSSDASSGPRKKGKPSKRKPGGQPGHEGKTRELVPSEQATEVHSHFPEACQGCGKKAKKSEQRVDPDLAREHRHQRWDILPILPKIVEDQCHESECSACGTVTRATLPEHVSRSMFGPNLMALVILLTGVYRMSKRGVASLLSDVFGTAVSIGSISNIEKRVSAALAIPVGLVAEMIKLARVVYADETTWKERARRFYIWTGVTCFGAVYLVRKSRASKVARELLGTAFKYVITDRYSGYSWLPLDWRQICWSHLIRDFKWLRDFGGEVGRIGTDLLACAKDLFRLWHRHRKGKLKRSSLQRLSLPIQERIRSLLEEGRDLKVKGASGMCKKMLSTAV